MSDELIDDIGNVRRTWDSKDLATFVSQNFFYKHSKPFHTKVITDDPRFLAPLYSVPLLCSPI